MSVRSVRVVPLAAAVLALSLVAEAHADKERIHLTPQGQAAARAVVVTRGDLGTSTTWTGGARKPDLSSSSFCSTYRPKQSDLVLNGAARTSWRAPGLQIESSGQVLATESMVRLDWQRSVGAPQMLPCVREGLSKQLGKGMRLVSVRWARFPKIARYTAAIRAVVGAKTPTGTVRVMTDFVLLGAGRTEILFSLTARLEAQAPVREAEIRLANLLVARIAV
jgi:hypothetical protein